MQPIYDKAKRIRLAIFDVDGVLTDGSLYLTDGGEEIKAFNSRDGHVPGRRGVLARSNPAARVYATPQTTSRDEGAPSPPNTLRRGS